MHGLRLNVSQLISAENTIIDSSIVTFDPSSQLLSCIMVSVLLSSLPSHPQIYFAWSRHIFYSRYFTVQYSTFIKIINSYCVDSIWPVLTEIVVLSLHCVIQNQHFGICSYLVLQNHFVH